VPLRELLLQVHFSAPLGVAHARRLLDRTGLFDETLGVDEDWDLWKRFHQAGAVFIFTDRKSGRDHICSQRRTHAPGLADAARS
jgi:hypothetical protein